MWFIRSTMSFVIFGLLPVAVIFLPPKVSSWSNITLHLGRLSIALMGLGAVMIGLSTSFSTLIIGSSFLKSFRWPTTDSTLQALVANTLGVAADLSALAFSANFFSSGLAGRILMLLSSLESAGTLLGIGILYPIYQWSLEKATTFAGGAPYYVCGVSNHWVTLDDEFLY